MNDFSFLLLDRCDAIKKIIHKYGEDNFVLSFSGGKDSTVLHYMLDIALPGNTIPRIFINTGIEYKEIVDFVHEMMKSDERIIEIRPEYPLGKVFKKYGYPFKSKEHSQLVHMYQRNGHSATTSRYYDPPENRKRYGCPKILKYQFEEGTDLKISAECCNKLKKEPFAKWQKENSKPYKMTGERIAEGGLRASHNGCMVVNKDGVLKKFKPLNPIKDSFMEWFINEHHVRLCSLYYEPFNFSRTGCLGCPYNVHIQKDLETLKALLPGEYEKATRLWKPVYEEYERLNYRIKK